jgi:hypothetical protein
MCVLYAVRLRNLVDLIGQKYFVKCTNDEAPQKIVLLSLLFITLWYRLIFSLSYLCMFFPYGERSNSISV